MHTQNPLLLQLFGRAYLTAVDWEALLACTREVSFSRSQAILSQDSLCTELYFVTTGVCRHYFYDAEGREVTSWFSEAGMLATDYRAFTEGVKAVFNVQALTDCSCLALSAGDLQNLYNNSKAWERAGRLINQQYLNQLIERNTFMFTKTSRQRYEEFSAQRGHLFNLVLLKHIASYLGMTLETLSRLRAGKY